MVSVSRQIHRFWNLVRWEAYDDWLRRCRESKVVGQRRDNYLTVLMTILEIHWKFNEIRFPRNINRLGKETVPFGKPITTLTSKNSHIGFEHISMYLKKIFKHWLRLLRKPLIFAHFDRHWHTYNFSKILYLINKSFLLLERCT